MKYLEFTPSPHLQSHIRLFQVIQLNSENLPGVIIDDGCFDLFVLNERIQFVTADGTYLHLPHVFCLNPKKLPGKFIINHINEVSLFSIKLQPWAGNTLLQMNSFSDLAILDCQILLPGIFDKLREYNFGNYKVARLIREIEITMQDQFRALNESNLIAKSVCEEIFETKGFSPIKEIISRQRYSRQKINKAFEISTHRSIKGFARLVRARQVIKYWKGNRDASLTNVSHYFNYFDQSHFIKDFNKIAGSTPKKFFKENNLVRELYLP